jgi:hypothetical protein
MKIDVGSLHVWTYPWDRGYITLHGEFRASIDEVIDREPTRLVPR